MVCLSIPLFSIKPIPLPELAQRRSVLFLFQTNFVNRQCKAFAQFYDGSEMRKGSSYRLVREKRVNLIKVLVARLRISCTFSWEEEHYPFFHTKKSISQNYELLFHISLRKQSLSDALQKQVCYKKLFQNLCLKIFEKQL